MNKILQNLINTGKVVSFTDDRIGEEGYNKIAEEVIKRLAKNNLYVKPEKYKWKVREIEFLVVVIGPDGIKIEEEKMKEVLDWLTSQKIKNIQKFLGLANYYQQFIKDFAFIARLLHNLVKKDQEWNWTENKRRYPEY